MTSRWLVAAMPLVVGVLVAVLYRTMGEVGQTALNVENIVLFGSATLGSAAAALAFGKGDYLRAAWGLMGLCYALLLLDTLLFGAVNVAHPRTQGALESQVSTAITIIANLATVLGLIRVSQAWKLAGIDLQVSRTTFWACIGAVLVGSGAALGSGFLDATKLLLAGDFAQGTSVASSLGDIASAVLLVPLVLTALSLRGGSLVWPWAMLSASTLLWLSVDFTDLVGSHLALAPDVVLPLEESLRVGACLFQLSAGLLQRSAITST